MLRSELFKLLHRRMTLILALLTVGLTLLVYVSLTVAATGSDAADADQETVDDLERLVAVESVPAFGDDVVWQLVSVMGVILISSSIGNEFSWRTVVTLAAWTGSRVPLMLAKIVVNTLLVAAGVVVGFLTCLAASVALGALRGTFASADLSGALLGDIGIAAAGTFAAALVYIMLAAAITMLGRNAALGISVGLALLFLEGLGIVVIDALGDSFAWAKDLTMNWNVQGLLAANGYVEGISSAPDPELPSAWQSLAVLLLYITGYIVTTLWLFARRDITE
jgi:ABC-type transport system involved in multi-copper enzyme maturation permease subunit